MNASISGTGTETVNVTGTQYVNLLTLNDANATFSLNSNASLTAYSGISLTALKELDLYGTLTVRGGSTTFDNTTIQLGNSSYSGHLNGQPSSSTATMTLGAHLTTNVGNGSIDASGYATLTNNGSIAVANQLSVYAHTFANTGTITGNYLYVSNQYYLNNSYGGHNQSRKFRHTSDLD